ncbi:MAG TPA: UDPGP type 1 family protein [Bacillota bacterium]|nr:UDPGP type 1 family protein [Bacillota bacterium]
MDHQFATAQALTTKYGQEHLLRFYPSLTSAQRANLLSQILALDFDLVARLYRELGQNDPTKSGNSKITPLPAQTWDDFPRDKQAGFIQTGLAAIRDGKVAAFLVAGGQGTRLGFAGPKGAFDLGLPSHKSLFQLQAERLTNLSRRGGRYIPWYIMTSPENHQETLAFFETHQYFGYPQSELCFFSQALLPILDHEGKIMLSAPDKITLGPNGNGGSFLALEKSGALADLKRRGIEWIFLYGVDNALVKVADPGFIGYTIHSGLSSSSKVVSKAHPEEKVGLLCHLNGRPAILEYSEMPSELAHQTTADGNLAFRNANIVSHLFRRDFLEASVPYFTQLPYHLAHKKMPTLDNTGNQVIPDAPNSYKFELFIFDLFPLLPDMAALLVDRAAEFAPVKNASGADSPATAREMVLNLHRHWLDAAGIPSELLNGRTIEISPLTSYAGESLNPESITSLLSGKEVVI